MTRASRSLQLESPTYDFADEVHFKQLIREKLAGNQEEMPRIKSKGSVLMELAHEMKLVKEEIANSKAGQSGAYEESRQQGRRRVQIRSCKIY